MTGPSGTHFDHLRNLYTTPKSTTESTNSSLKSNSPSSFKLSTLLNSNEVTFAAHAEDSDMMQWQGMTLGTAMFAGATAGVTEHVCMFPVDTVKTRMQMNTSGQANFAQTFVNIIRKEGAARLYRGLPAAIYGAIPAHSAYFGTYEYVRRLTGASRETYTPIPNLLTGMAATVAHDAVGVPLDVVKQRMQMYGSSYRGVSECVRTILAKEGVQALYASYATTVLLNIPYMCTYFSIYEGLQTLFHQKLPEYHLTGDIVSGGLAGGVAGFISTPLDVIKTRLQTQIIENGHRRLNTMQMTKKIFAEEGLKGFTRGGVARFMLFMPSAAICWTVYEALKRVLPNFNPPDHDDHDDDHHHHHHHHHDHHDHKKDKSN